MAGGNAGGRPADQRVFRIRASRFPAAPRSPAQAGQHAGQDATEPVEGGFQRLRQDAGLADDRHEIRVAGPAGHDMGVEVGDAAAGGGAEIEADVESIGIDRRPQHFLAQDDDLHEVGALGRRELRQVGHGAKGDREQMAGIVGKAVQNQIGPPAAMEDVRGAVVPSAGSSVNSWPFPDGFGASI